MRNDNSTTKIGSWGSKNYVRQKFTKILKDSSVKKLQLWFSVILCNFLTCRTLFWFWNCWFPKPYPDWQFNNFFLYKLFKLRGSVDAHFALWWKKCHFYIVFANQDQSYPSSGCIFAKNKQQFSTCILLDDMTFVNECKSTQLGYIQSCDY